MINLHLTMESGQPVEFLWKCSNGVYERLLNGRVARIWQSGDDVEFEGIDRRYVSWLLRLEDNLDEIYEVISTHKVMREAIEQFKGLRITRNDLWETIVSFIISINNNIPRIKKSVQILLDSSGKMPTNFSEEVLRRAKIGFRERYLLRSAEMYSQGFLSGIEKLGYEEARERLMQLPGVGCKVAECILLFALDRLEAFPVDVWISRAMKHYFGVEKNILEFAREHWHPYEGYAQQYLYMKIRTDFSKK